MLNQLNSIRSFVETRLRDVPVLWSDVQAMPDSNGDRASAIIPVHGRRFRIEAVSAYIQGPLGQLTLTDLTDQSEVRGQKSDATWDAMAKKMLGKAVAQEWDAIGPSINHEPPTAPIRYPDFRVPYLGQGVTFYCGRGEPISGMLELAAIVTQVVADTIISLTIFPPTGEQFYRNNLVRRHDGQQFNCWDFSVPAPAVSSADKMLEMQAEDKMLEIQADLAKAQLARARDLNDAEMAMAQSPRRPGRPRKNPAPE